MTNLTDKWRKGELTEGFYYFKLPNGEINTGTDFKLATLMMCKDGDKIEVLEKVPTFEEWDKLNNTCHELEKETACLTVDNVNLKKWCEEFNALEVAKENTKLKTENKWYSEQLNEGVEINAELEAENTKLKELLKEAYPVIEFGDGAMMSKWEENWLAKAKEILGEE